MIYAIVLFAIIILDQVTKIIAAVQPEGWNVELISWNSSQLLGFRYVENDGAAFGSLGDKPWAQTFFAVLTCVVLPVLFVIFLRLKNDKKWLKTTIILILAGTIGNFIDRLVFKYVIDFIDMYFYVCNIADVALTVGAIMLVFWYLFLDDEALIPVKKLRQKSAEKKQNG